VVRYTALCEGLFIHSPTWDLGLNFKTELGLYIHIHLSEKCETIFTL